MGRLAYQVAKILSWNAAGDLIAIAYPLYSDREHPVQIIDATRYEVLTSIEVLALWTQVVWHPADNLIAAGTWSGETLVLDALTGEVFFYFQEQESDRHPRIYSNSTMAVCWFSKSVIAIVTQWETYIVDVELNKILQCSISEMITLNLNATVSVKFISAQEGIFHVEIGALSESFRPWRNDFSLVERLFPESSEFAPRLLDEKFSPDGNRLVTIAEGCVIKVFDIRSGRLLAHIRGGLYFVQFPYSPFQDVLAWHPDGSRFAAVGQFGGVRIWDGKTYELLQQYGGFESGYGEISESLDNYSEQELHQIEASNMSALRRWIRSFLRCRALIVEDGNCYGHGLRYQESCL